MSNERNVGCFTIGGVCAVIISAALNHSFWWGLLHFFLGWFYVLYTVFFRTKEIIPSLKSMFI
jgi:hypothetical protein